MALLTYANHIEFGSLFRFILAALDTKQNPTTFCPQSIINIATSDQHTTYIFVSASFPIKPQTQFQFHTFAAPRL